MTDFLANRWMRILLIAATIAMCSFALRETASITQPLMAILGEVLAPVAVGFALAYVVTPVVDAMSRWGINRTVAAGLLFGVGSLLLVVALILIVPPVVKQSIDLSVRLFQGEPYTDTNDDKLYTPGEPYVDVNNNHERDPAIIARFAGFLQESQNRVRVAFGLGLNESSLAFLHLYEQETRADRDWLSAMVVVARHGQGAAEWPKLSTAPSTDTATDVTPDPTEKRWSPAWPGPLARELDEARAYVPEVDQAQWQRLVVAAGDRLFHRHADLIAALHRAKNSVKDTAQGDLEERIRALWKKSLTGDERKAASTFALALEGQAKAGHAAARELLGAVGANVEPTGQNNSLTDAMADIESSVKGSVGDISKRVGAWAKASLSGIDSLFSFAIAVLLVPIYSFFLLLGMPKIRTFIKDYLPRAHHDQVVRITRDIEKVVAAFFRGRLVICTICAIIGCLGFLAIGLFGVVVPYGMLWGVGIGLATAIPLAGLVFIIPAAAITLLQPGAGIVDVVAVVGVYAVVQGVEAALIPLIMGREVELHPVTLIVALLLCGKLLGVIGLILAVPIAASFRILLREYFWPRLKHWSDTGRWALPGPSDHL